MMSGSGPTVFGLFDDEDTAKKAYKAMRSSHLADRRPHRGCGDIITNGRL